MQSAKLCNETELGEKKAKTISNRRDREDFLHLPEQKWH
jgi:hypothetical protein